MHAYNRVAPHLGDGERGVEQPEEQRGREGERVEGAAVGGPVGVEQPDADEDGGVDQHGEEEQHACVGGMRR